MNPSTVIEPLPARPVRVPAADHPARVSVRKLLGEAAWLSLPPATRSRFADHAGDAGYSGTFDVVRASFAGKLLATLCRLIGTPVAPFTGKNVPATVHVVATRDGGTAWQRIYQFSGREPCVVESIKRMSREGMLVEALPARLRMGLDVYARDGVLHFVSNVYYFEVGRWRIAVPDWLPPGITHVEHIDLGQGAFRFTMRVRHRWLGEVFYQTGCFRATPPASR
jgi:hypothetical protein